MRLGGPAAQSYSTGSASRLLTLRLPSCVPSSRSLRPYLRHRGRNGQISAVIWVATAINACNRVSILGRHSARPWVLARSRSRSPDARSACRCTAARTSSADPTMRTFCFARVTAV